MAKQHGLNKLSAVACRNAKKLIGDGGGLWLHVDQKSGNKRWSFRYAFHGDSHEMCLGPMSLVTLAEARDARDEARRLLRAGISPLDQRRKKQQSAYHTFSSVAKLHLDELAKTWKDTRNFEYWSNQLESGHLKPLLSTPVELLSTENVLHVLQPIWAEKAATASRVRGFIEAVLAHALARGWRQGDNPAQWRGHLSALLPKSKRNGAHHAALPYGDAAECMRKLRELDGSAAQALQMVVLTATRSGEVRGARWQEFDLPNALWTIPADRMKVGKPHRVPLSRQATALLSGIPASSPDALVFPGPKSRAVLTDVTVMKALRKAGYEDITVHGFRSSFRDWGAETTTAANELLEMCLAHAVGNSVERAYRRGDLFEKRRALMQQWADYLDGAKASANIVEFRKV
jgi:integrase